MWVLIRVEKISVERIFADLELYHYDYARFKNFEGNKAACIELPRIYIQNVGDIRWIHYIFGTRQKDQESLQDYTRIFKTSYEVL